MSTTRYLEFDSTYRDRVMYPSPADFVIEMAQSGQGNKMTARDPVSNASPILIWNSSFTENASATSIQNITVDPSPYNQGNSIFLLSTVGGNYLRQVRNFYVGACLGFTPLAGGVVTLRRIIDYQPLNDNNAIVTLDSPLPDSLVGQTTFYINNPTPLDTTLANAVIKFFIPGSNQCLTSTERTQNYGLGGENYYVNYYVMNTDTGTYRKITAFDMVTRLATLDSATPAGEDWQTSTGNFAIRETIPVEYSTTAEPKQILYATARAIQLGVQYISDIPSTNEYNGDFLRISPSVSNTSPYPAPVTEERRIQKYVYSTGTVVSVSSQTTIKLDHFSNDYIGTIITRVTAGPSYGESAIITGYNTSTGEIKTDAPLPTEIWTGGNSWLIRTCILSSPFSAIPVPNSVTPSPAQSNLYEIELFSRDNYNPFIYTGSIVSSQEVVCYEVELLNLILPNTILASGRGGRPIFYPYLYVELQQISSGGSVNKNVIYSNNPHSTRMLYRAVVDDTPIPAISPFIKIDGDGMVHVIKFKPNDAFRFAVYHADGELFETVLVDQFSPTAPNPLVQISACFAFKRV